MLDESGDPAQAHLGDLLAYSGRLQDRTFAPYSTRQNMFAGMNPNWPVCSPMMQIRTLLTPASAQPSQYRRPTRIVDTMVKTQEI
jgi:hypothetical protein